MSQKVHGDKKPKKANADQAKKLENEQNRKKRREAALAKKAEAKTKAMADNLPFNEGIPAARFVEDFDAAYAEATKPVVKAETPKTEGDKAVETAAANGEAAPAPEPKPLSKGAQKKAAQKAEYEKQKAERKAKQKAAEEALKTAETETRNGEPPTETATEEPVKLTAAQELAAAAKASTGRELSEAEKIGLTPEAVTARQAENAAKAAHDTGITGEAAEEAAERLEKAGTDDMNVGIADEENPESDTPAEEAPVEEAPVEEKADETTEASQQNEPASNDDAGTESTEAGEQVQPELDKGDEESPTPEVPEKPEAAPEPVKAEAPKLTVAVDNTTLDKTKHTADIIKAAREFYGSVFTDERADNLTEAHRNLMMAIKSYTMAGMETAVSKKLFEKALTWEAKAFPAPLQQAA